MATNMQDKAEKQLSIGQVSEQTGLSIETLRYYERSGLLRNTISRDSAGRRKFTTADLNWIIFVSKLRSTRMPIDMIRQYADLARQGDSTAAARLALLRTHRKNVRRDLAEITTALAAINHKIDIYQHLI